MKKVYIVGIGMEGRQTLTQQAQEAIDSADCLIGAERMLKPFSDISKITFSAWNPRSAHRFAAPFAGSILTVSRD